MAGRSILKEVTRVFVSFVEGDGMPGHEAAHDFAEWGRAGSQQNVKMVWDQGPGVTLGLGFFENVCKTFQEESSILIIRKDFSAFDPPAHYMLEKAGGV